MHTHPIPDNFTALLHAWRKNGEQDLVEPCMCYTGASTDFFAFNALTVTMNQSTIDRLFPIPHPPT